MIAVSRWNCVSLMQWRILWTPFMTSLILIFHVLTSMSVVDNWQSFIARLKKNIIHARLVFNYKRDWVFLFQVYLAIHSYVASHRRIGLNIHQLDEFSKNCKALYTVIEPNSHYSMSYVVIQSSFGVHINSPAWNSLNRHNTPGVPMLDEVHYIIELRSYRTLINASHLLHLFTWDGQNDHIQNNFWYYTHASKRHAKPVAMV